MEQTLDEKKSLQVIYETIENAKAKFRDDGFYFLLWGWLVLVASLAHYILFNFIAFEHYYIGWPIVMIAGAIVSGVHGYRQSKEAVVWSHFDRAVGFLWIGFTVALLLILAMSFIGVIPFSLTNPLIIVLFSMGTFVSGAILKFKPLIYGAILGWIISVFSFLNPSSVQMLLGALAVLVAYLIPGYMLKLKK